MRRLTVTPVTVTQYSCCTVQYKTEKKSMRPRTLKTCFKSKILLDHNVHVMYRARSTAGVEIMS